GPDSCDFVSTGDLVDLFCKKWQNIKWINKHDGGPHEASFLKLDNNKIKEVFNWKPNWHIDKTMDMIVRFTKIYFENKDNIPNEMDYEIKEFFGE
nr:hypothetical protein [Acholeplasmatales bacterium]